LSIKKAASVSKGRMVSNICRMFYGFAAGAGAGLACAEPSTSKPQSPSLCSLPLFRAIYFLISAWRLRIRVSASGINLAAVAHAVHAHNPDFIGDLINHPVITHANTPVVPAAGKFAATGGRGSLASPRMAIMTRS
jgi:hypothetical protein